jgi:hypothetical protein
LKVEFADFAQSPKGAVRAILSIVSIVRGLVAFTPSRHFGLLGEGRSPRK